MKIPEKLTQNKKRKKTKSVHGKSARSSTRARRESNRAKIISNLIQQENKQKIAKAR